MPCIEMPNISKKHPGHKIIFYLLHGVVFDRPNQIWAIDNSYIPMAREFAFLAAVLDYATRYVLSHRV
jgi:putative transposase